MEVEVEGKDKKSSILKKLESYLSINRGAKSPSSSSSTRPPTNMFSKSKSWHGSRSKKNDKNPDSRQHLAPNGCLSVCVGPEKQRFFIKTKYINHPLFKMLLEDAELEYGFSNAGPLLLPCEVDLFYQILAEMESVKEFDQSKCGGYAYGNCSPFVNPARRLGKSDMAKGYSSYGLLTPPRPRWLKTHHF